MAEVTITLPSNQVISTGNGRRLSWNQFDNLSGISLGDELSASGAEIYFKSFLTPTSTGSNTDTFDILLTLTPTESATDLGPDFSTQMESEGTIQLVASSGQYVVVTGIDDSMEPYRWTPSNFDAVRMFATHVLSLQDRELTIIFDDNAGLMYERVNGVYVLGTMYERVNGVYVEVDPFERVSGVYTQ